MSATNINPNSELRSELRSGMQEGIVLPGDEDSLWMIAPLSLLRSALAALSDGRVSETVAHFDERFKFNDHALTLEFAEKTRLTEFLQKSREMFPDAALQVVSLMESGDHAIAEWKLTATQTPPSGPVSYQFPISVRGSTIVRVENGKIVEWSDYYDHASSRRTSLASYFTEWIEY